MSEQDSLQSQLKSQHDAALASLPETPGKVIAIHLSYESRAAQRGRRPNDLSYFFKATSSLAGTDGVIVRPKGAELLAFEGEVALVIGKRARWVPQNEAWGYVGWITASNDFGIYDMRAADRGSNVRSKGGDGYTPIGPVMIEAENVDPKDVDVRTWVNGELAQEDSSSKMIFSFAQMVADLSQHFTLEPGDIILAGTPAGSTVVQPGDVVEVEVTAGDKSSGKLKTTVLQGDHDFDRTLGNVPETNDKQREDAYGTPVEPLITEDIRKRLEALPVAALSQQLRKLGLNNVSIDGVFAMHPEMKMVGVAKTLRFLPNREDLFKAHGGGHNTQKQAFDAINPGEVLVIEARGEKGSGTLGDILALRAKVRGAEGIVTDGGVRDYKATFDTDIPVFSRGAHPAVLGRKHFPWDTDQTIACGGATVQPGDVIVGDSDGVIVIPPPVLMDVIEGAEAGEVMDAWILDRVAKGDPVQGLFPMNAETRAQFEAETE